MEARARVAHDKIGGYGRGKLAAVLVQCIYGGVLSSGGTRDSGIAGNGGTVAAARGS